MQHISFHSGRVRNIQMRGMEGKGGEAGHSTRIMGTRPGAKSTNSLIRPSPRAAGQTPFCTPEGGGFGRHHPTWVGSTPGGGGGCPGIQK